MDSLISLFSTVIPFLVVLGIVVFVHEYGHYIVGRWCGIHADVFSLGFGPVVTSWHDKRGTKWQIAALPLGGYVKFLGDSDASSRADPDAIAGLSERDRARSFPGASLLRRALTVVAGPFANFIFSAIVFAGLILWTGVPSGEPVVGKVLNPEDMCGFVQDGDRFVSINGTAVETLQDAQLAISDSASDTDYAVVLERNGQTIDVTVPKFFPTRVADVSPRSPALKAGLKPGDLIIEADGQPMRTFSDMKTTIVGSAGADVALKVDRAGEIIELTIAAELAPNQDENGELREQWLIGVIGNMAFQWAVETASPLDAIWLGVLNVWNVITNSLNGLKHIIIGTLGAENLSGPLGIALVSGDRFEAGIEPFITMIAVISTAIGLLNLFPIPVLDGGHLLFYLYEAVTGRLPSDRATNVAMSIGLAMILLLMVFATYNDILKLM